MSMKLQPGLYTLRFRAEGACNGLDDVSLQELTDENIVLRIARAGANLTLSWPVSATGVVVQSATQLLSHGAGWTSFGGTPVQLGDRYELVIDPNAIPPDPIRFFRLHRP